MRLVSSPALLALFRFFFLSCQLRSSKNDTSIVIFNHLEPCSFTAVFVYFTLSNLLHLNSFYRLAWGESINFFFFRKICVIGLIFSSLLLSFLRMLRSLLPHTYTQTHPQPSTSSCCVESCTSLTSYTCHIQSLRSRFLRIVFSLSTHWTRGGAMNSLNFVSLPTSCDSKLSSSSSVSFWLINGSTSL